MKFFNKIIGFLETLENSNISVYFWIVSLFSIAFVRCFLEFISDIKPNGGKVFEFYGFFVHIPIFFLATALCFILFFYFLSNKESRDIVKITKVFLFGFMFIWLGPILDIIFTGGGGAKIAYLNLNFRNFYENLFYLFTRPRGLTAGIQFEIIIISIFIAFYFYFKNRSLIKTFLNFLLNYSVGFFLGALPGALAFASYFFENFKIPKMFNSLSVLQKHFLDITFFKNSIISLSGIFYLDNDLFYKIWNYVISWFLIILIVILLNVWFYLYDKNKFLAFWKNARFERVIYYLSFIFIGFFIAYKLNVYYFSFNFFNVLNLLVLVIAGVSSWLLAVGLNDIEDQKIDRISHPERPLIQKMLSIEDIKIYNFFLFLIILFSGLVLNYEVFLFLVIANACAFLYSSSPFRLKRIAFLSNIFLGFVGALIVFTGFSLASGGLWFDKFPVNLIFILIGAIFLIAQIKDIGDFHGDKAENIRTIPVIFGEKVGKIIISLMVLGALALVVWFIGGFFNILVSIIFGIVALFLINKKIYKEQNLFILFFIYVLVLFILDFLVK